MQNDRDSLSDLRGGRHDAIASRRQDPTRALRTRRGRLPGLCRIASLSAQIKLLPTDLGGRGAAAYETARELEEGGPAVSLMRVPPPSTWMRLLLLALRVAHPQSARPKSHPASRVQPPTPFTDVRRVLALQVPGGLPGPGGPRPASGCSGRERPPHHHPAGAARSPRFPVSTADCEGLKSDEESLASSYSYPSSPAVRLAPVRSCTIRPYVVAVERLPVGITNEPRGSSDVRGHQMESLAFPPLLQPPCCGMLACRVSPIPGECTRPVMITPPARSDK
jgi:hypothetical protein